MTAVRRLAALVLLGGTAVGCGIRPTAVPVDAGAPASRTACATPVQVPKAVAAPPDASAPASATPVPKGKAAPSANPAPLFSATATPSPSASHCP